MVTISFFLRCSKPLKLLAISALPLGGAGEQFGLGRARSAARFTHACRASRAPTGHCRCVQRAYALGNRGGRWYRGGAKTDPIRRQPFFHTPPLKCGIPALGQLHPTGLEPPTPCTFDHLSWPRRWIATCPRYQPWGTVPGTQRATRVGSCPTLACSVGGCVFVGFIGVSV